VCSPKARGYPLTRSVALHPIDKSISRFFQNLTNPGQNRIFQKTSFSQTSVFAQAFQKMRSRVFARAKSSPTKILLSSPYEGAQTHRDAFKTRIAQRQFEF
tara:strand:+ start:2782 stop:3084 length:303 start_codon:yes stop_codon:yes gene_type:complete